MIVESGHRLGTIVPCTLAFLSLIMGLCSRARIIMPLVVHETINGVVDDRYIERYCITKENQDLNNPPPLVQQPFDERTACTYTWNMLKANYRAFMFMHDSMHQVNHSIPSPEAFQQHTNWPEGRLFYPDGATDEDEESEESEENGEEEFMSDED